MVCFFTRRFVVVCTACCWPLPNIAAAQFSDADAASVDHRSIEIEWLDQTRTLIAEGSSYGRMARLSGREIVCVYSRRGRVFIRRSPDNGHHWHAEVLVADFQHGVATNPEILVLTSGRLLLMYNERPRVAGHPFTISARRSDDGGHTWSRPRRVYTADTLWENGCWEPAAVQLPGGEIQLFFANENPYPRSNEQEITLIRSVDDGFSWGRAGTASFRAGHRDGMPVPLVLAGARGVVLVIEDNGLNGRFKPAIVHTSREDNWQEPPAGAESRRRWAALETPLAADVYAGAPYLVQLPSGITVLSVQSAEGRGDLSTHRYARMAVYVGDSTARNFTNRSFPFEVPSGASGLWNSLFVKDEATITAISGTTINGTRGLWAIDGRVCEL